MADIDHKCIFALSEAANGTPVMNVGITEDVWKDLIEKGLTQTFDLTKIGLPIQLVLFGCKDHDAGMKIIQEGASKAGVPILDERRRNFGIEGD